MKDSRRLSFDEWYNDWYKNYGRWDYMGVFLVSWFVGMIGGFGLGYFTNAPEKVYVKDLNNDNRPDVVIKRDMGLTSVYLGQEDGRLKSLSELEKELTREQINSIWEKVNDIK